MWWALVLACSCGTDVNDDYPGPQPARVPSALVVPHNPKALLPYPKCVSYSEAVCDVCGAQSEPCITVKKVNDLCAQRETCREDSCEAGEKRLRADPKGANSELCTE